VKSLEEIIGKYYSRINVQNIDTLKNKVFLITGASGLVGSNFTAYLDFISKKRELDIKIIGIVKSTPEYWLPHSKNIRYIQNDLSTTSLDENLKFDYIFHCATYAQPKKFLQHPHETVTLNIEVLFRLLELAKKNNATFLYPSSAEIYGEADEKHLPTEEDYFGYVNTLSERAIYAESKRLAETICYLYSKTTKVKIARLLICYGPGIKLDDQRVYCEFIKNSLTKGEIIMMDAGTAQRTLCFITDAIEMLLNILLNSKEMVYNVCGTETVTIRELAEMIAKINRANVKAPTQKKDITGTPNRSTLSNKKYRNEFNKESFVALNDGLQITSGWFKNLLNFS